MASFTGGVMASRRPVRQRGGDGAAVALQHVADPRIDGIAQALHEGGVAQRPAAARRRLRGLDRAHHEPGGADAGKIHVAAEIVGARPAAVRAAAAAAPSIRRNCRPRARCPCAPTAARARVLPPPRALSIETTRSTKRSVRSRMSRVSTKPASVTEKAGRASTPCAIAGGLPGRDGKAGGDGGDHHGDRKQLLPPQQHGGHAQHDRRCQCDRQHRLTIRGKIECDAGAERDRHPWQQPPSAGFGAEPSAQLCKQRGPWRKTRWCKPAGLRRATRRPRAGIALGPAWHPARFRHRLTPCDPLGTIRLPEAVIRRLAERIENSVNYC